jgi:membrane fusion protein (multidrug efflux system)
MEVEIPNPTFRLKPGMYAKVNLEVETRENVLLVSKVALVDSEGSRGVYQANAENRAEFKPVKVGLEDAARAEILEGLSEGDTIISTGAGALRRNDQLMIAGQDSPSGQQRGPGGPGGRGMQKDQGGEPGQARQPNPRQPG